jgi:hypothetical protein
MANGSGIPWSIKGVSADARAAAREAAKRSGEPLGAWLARIIRETAEAEAREREGSDLVPQEDSEVIAQDDGEVIPQND